MVERARSRRKRTFIACEVDLASSSALPALHREHDLNVASPLSLQTDSVLTKVSFYQRRKLMFDFSVKAEAQRPACCRRASTAVAIVLALISLSTARMAVAADGTDKPS